MSRTAENPSRLLLPPRAILAVGLAILLVLVIAAALAFWPSGTPADDETGGPAYAGEVDVYLTPTCGCCHQYLDYLRGEGFAVTPHEMEDISGTKDNLGIPADMRSCHTSVINGYFVEGHVPVAAIQKLTLETPPVDGIALPGMPSGSPGMGGSKADDFVIYAVVGGQTSVFMVL